MASNIPAPEAELSLADIMDDDNDRVDVPVSEAAQPQLSTLQLM